MPTSPDDVVYQMAKALYENKDAMKQTFAPFAQFDPKDMAGDIGVAQYHPGAVKFFKEAGIWKE